YFDDADHVDRRRLDPRLEPGLSRRNTFEEDLHDSRRRVASQGDVMPGAVIDRPGGPEIVFACRVAHGDADLASLVDPAPADVIIIAGGRLDADDGGTEMELRVADLTGANPERDRGGVAQPLVQVLLGGDEARLAVEAQGARARLRPRRPARAAPESA